MPISAKNPCAILRRHGYRRPGEYCLARVFLVVLPQGVQDGQRRAVELPRDAPGDLAFPAAGFARQRERAAEDELSLGRADLAEVRVLRDLRAVSSKEPFDAADEEPDAPLAVRKDKPPGG